jgi:hypothetical protein
VVARSSTLHYGSDSGDLRAIGKALVARHGLKAACGKPSSVLRAAFRPAAGCALALNTMDTSTTSLLGTLIACTDDWGYGLSVVERAMQLNPCHAGRYISRPSTMTTQP